MSEKLPITPDAEEDYCHEMLEEHNSVVSATECTGMISVPPINEYEAESYDEIYVVPKVINNKELRN